VPSSTPKRHRTPHRLAHCSSSRASTRARDRTFCSTTCWAPVSQCFAGATTRAPSLAMTRLSGGGRSAGSHVRCRTAHDPAALDRPRRPRCRHRRRPHRRAEAWFDANTDSVLFLRPDRCIAGACIAQRAPELSASLFNVLCLTQGGGSGATRPSLYVAQPATESSGTVTGSS